jgi:hypothetical protein
MPIKTVSMSSIRADVRAQPRTTINTDFVAEYVEAMANGAAFPPIVVFEEPSTGVYYIGDGFHRHYAHQGLGLAEVECDVRPGGLREAILFSCSANAAHGVRRSNEDKRRAVLALLGDAEWVAWSNREIARRCAVDEQLVRRLRPQPEPDTAGIPQYAERTFVHPKTGQPTTMNTARIGTAPPPRPAPAAPAEPAWTPDDVTPAAHTPAPPPPPPAFTPAPVAPANNPLFREIENDRIHAIADEIFRQFEKLPPPEEAARVYPTLLRHCMSAEKARRVSLWFSQFADAWDATYGESNVAAE